MERIFVVGTGKASAPMAANLEKILGPRIQGGWVNVKYGHGRKLKRIHIQEAGHPLPDAKGLEGAREIIRMLKDLTAKDLVIFLISGGGSALLPLPVSGITLEEKQKVTQLLLRCGATIQEINTLRKHLSLLKGGGLAKRAYPATLISLILSDVIGDPLEVIASGPTVPDSSTFADCARILDKFNLWGEIPPAAAEHLREGLKGNREETLKEGDPAFARVQNVIVGNNLLAMKAAREKAPGARLPNADSLLAHRRGNAGSGEGACGHCQGGRPLRSTPSSAGLHSFRRGNDGHPQRSGKRRKKPGVFPGRRPGDRWLEGYGPAQRRNGWHGRADGCGRSFCRWADDPQGERKRLGRPRLPK